VVRRLEGDLTLLDLGFGQLPLRVRHRHPEVLLLLAHRQGRGRAVEHRVRLDVLTALGTGAGSHREDALLDRAELLPDAPTQPLAVLESFRKIGDAVAAVVDQVALPAGPHTRVT